MANQTDREMAKEILIAWLHTQATGAGTQAKNQFSSGEAQKNGEFIGEVYKAVLEAVSHGHD